MGKPTVDHKLSGNEEEKEKKQNWSTLAEFRLL
jgi:hypothetical protein